MKERSFIFLCYLFFMPIVPVQSFEVHGVVKSLDTESPIPEAKIYELYKDAPVAITDSNGIFKYETGSDSPVEIHAEKKVIVRLES